MVLLKKNYIHSFFAFLTVFFIFAISYHFFKQLYNPTVSVIMPVYNRSDFLPYSIESVLNQRFKNFELILVDDGSTDNSVSIIQAYAKKDKRIRYIVLSRNTGISNARNTGIKYARGKYIATLDSDDTAYPDWLKSSVSFMEKNKDVTAVLPNADFYYDKGNGYQEDTPKHPLSRPLIYLLYNSLINGGTVYRTDFLKKHNIRYDTNYISAEDYDLFMQIILNKGKIRRIQFPYSTVLYRIHSHEPSFLAEGYKNEYKIRKKLYNTLQLSFESNQLTKEEQCLILQKFAEKYPQVLSRDTLEMAFYQKCQKEPTTSIMFKHTSWEEKLALFPKDKQACLYQNHSDCAYILQQTDDTLKLFWKNYHTIETFRKEKDHYILINKENKIPE